MSARGFTIVIIVALVVGAVYVTAIAPPTTPNAADSLARTQACVVRTAGLGVDQNLTAEFSAGLGTSHVIGLTFIASQVAALFFDSDAQAKRAEAGIRKSLLTGNRSAAKTAKLTAELSQQLVRHGGVLLFWAKRAPSLAERSGVGACIYAVRDPSWKSLAFLHGKSVQRPYLPS